MDILIPDSWLRDYLKTKASPSEIAKALSLYAVSVDRLTKTQDGDSVYHIEVPPNRYDCLSVIGVAREAAAVLPRFNHQAELRNLPLINKEISGGHDKNKLNVKVENPKLCPRFSAVIVENVEIKPSPELVRQRLEKVGIRSLNNVIDITNYLMIDTGQPMHAFDYDKLAPVNGKENVKQMVLRESIQGEKLVTLDGTEHELPEGSIVISDGEKLIDLCGIMGGENSAISKTTKKVILFAQIYDPLHIRKTSMALPLRTEAAQRFEKGLDLEMVIPTLEQSFKKLKETGGAELSSALIDINLQPFKPRTVQMTQAKLNQYMGISLEPKEVVVILESLGIRTTFSSKGGDFELLTFNCLIPSFRDKDINIEEDLIEEVARLYGYHNLPETLPVGELPADKAEPIFSIENRVKVMLKDIGFTEVLNLSLTSKQLAGDGALVHVLNPLGAETEYLIADPIPSEIELIKKNMARFPEIKVFEISKAHRPQEGKKLPHSTDFLTVAILSPSFSDVEKSFLEVKGLSETIFKEFSVEDYVFKDYSTFPYQYSMPFEDNASFVIWSGKEIKSGKIIGVGGRNKEIKNLWLIKINLEAVEELRNPLKKFLSLPEYPPIIEEISFYLPTSKSYNEAVEIIKSSGGKLLKDVTLSDLYVDEQLRKEGKRSLTFKLTFQDPERTLTGEEVQPVRENIIKTLKDRLNAEPRTK